RVFTLRDFDVRAKEAAEPSLLRTFLRPVEVPAFGIDRDADTPSRGVRPGSGIAVARIDEGLDVRAIEVGAHHTHPFAIAPIQLAILPIELELFGRERAPLRNDGLAIPPVEIGAFDGAVVPVGNAHVGPVDEPAFDVYRNAVGKPTLGDNDLAVGPIRVQRDNAVAAGV